MHEGDAGLFLNTNDIDAFLDDLLVFVDATAAVGSVGTWAFELAFHLRVVTRLGLIIDDLDNAIDFVVGDKAALCPAEIGCAGREKQHVAFAKQFVGAHSIENGAGIDSGSDLKGDTGRDVGLDDTGDDIDAWPLGGHDAVDAGCAGHLRDAGDAALYLVLGHQHEVGQFVDDHDDVAQFVRNLDVVLARDADLLIHLNREAFAGFVER